MKQSLKSWSLAVLMIAAAPTAWAEATMWAICDGQPAPQSLASSFGRQLLASATFGLAGMPERNTESWIQIGAQAVGACSAALASPQLEPFWQRRLSLQISRALAYMDDANWAEARADLLAMDATIPAAERSPHLDRSVLMVRRFLLAVIDLRDGRAQAGVAALAALSAERPYSLFVQRRLSDTLLTVPPGTPGLAAARSAVAARLVSLDPRQLHVLAEEALALGDSAAALVALRGFDPSTPPEQATIALRIATLEALAGDTRAGHAALDHYSAMADANRNKTTTRGLLRRKEEPDTAARELAASIDAQLPFLRTALALAENDQTALAKLLDQTQWSLSQLLATLAEAVQKQVPAIARAGHENSVLLADPAALKARITKLQISRRASGWPSLYGSTAIAARPHYLRDFFMFEDPDVINSYSARNPLLKASGFSDSPLPSGTGRSISFLGQLSPPQVVDEMVMLRGAELARKAGATHMLVLGREDYQRYWQKTYGGAPIGERRPEGFKTDIRIDFLSDTEAAANHRALPVADVLAALAPIYAPRLLAQSGTERHENR